MNQENRSYYLLLHLTVLIFGLTGVLGKLIHVDAEVIVWYRVWIGLVGIAVYLLFTRSSFSVSRNEWGNLGFVGIIIAAHWITFFGAIKASNVSVALTCMASSTFFTALIEPFYYKRKIKRYELLLGLVVIFAISLIFSIDLKYKMGIVLGLTSAFLASLFTVLNGRLIQRVPAKLISLYQMLAALMIVSLYLFFVLPSTDNLALSYSDWIYLLILGLVCTSFAFMASVEVMKKISPYTVSMSVNLEPIYTIGLALVIWPETEKMPPLFYYAFTLIVAAIFINAYMSKKDNMTSSNSL